MQVRRVAPRGARWAVSPPSRWPLRGTQGGRCSCAVRPPEGDATPTPDAGVRAREAGRRPPPLFRAAPGAEARVGAPDSPMVGRAPAPGCLLRSWVRGIAGWGLDGYNAATSARQAQGPQLQRVWLIVPGMPDVKLPPVRGARVSHTCVPLLSDTPPPSTPAARWVASRGGGSAQGVRGVARLDKKRPAAGAVQTVRAVELGHPRTGAGWVRRPLRQGWGVRVGVSTYLGEGKKDCSGLIPETLTLSALDSRKVKTLCP